MLVKSAMADEYVVNGDVDVDGLSNNDRDDADFRRSDLMKKMEKLERERNGLAHENDEIRQSIRRRSAEIEELRGDKETLFERLGEMEKRVGDSVRDKKALESIAAKTSELDTEVSRLRPLGSETKDLRRKP